MKYFIAFLTLLVWTAVASAETLSWTAPTTRVDGVPLAVEEISHYTLYCGEEAVQEFPANSATGSYEVNKQEILPAYGEYSCYLTLTDTEGLTSDPSNSVILNWNPARPSRPVNLLIITAGG